MAGPVEPSFTSTGATVGDGMEYEEEGDDAIDAIEKLGAIDAEKASSRGHGRDKPNHAELASCARDGVRLGMVPWLTEQAETGLKNDVFSSPLPLSPSVQPAPAALMIFPAQFPT